MALLTMTCSIPFTYLLVCLHEIISFIQTVAVVISSLLYPQDGKYLLNEQLHGQMKV